MRVRVRAKVRVRLRVRVRVRPARVRVDNVTYACSSSYSMRRLPQKAGKQEEGV